MPVQKEVCEAAGEPAAPPPPPGTHWEREDLCLDIKRPGTGRGVPLPPPL